MERVLIVYREMQIRDDWGVVGLKRMIDQKMLRDLDNRETAQRADG